MTTTSIDEEERQASELVRRAAELAVALGRVQQAALPVEPADTLQKPYAFAVYFPDQQREELVHDLDDLIDDMTNLEYKITKLHDHLPALALPVEPAPEVYVPDTMNFFCMALPVEPAKAEPSENKGPGSASWRLNMLVNSLEQRFPHPKPCDSKKMPEAYALESIDRLIFAATAQPTAPGIDYAALYEFATANDVNYNELCALVENARNALALPVQPIETPVPWHHRVLALHPKSEPDFWPDELRLKYMAAELGDYRAMHAKPMSNGDVGHNFWAEIALRLPP